METHNSILKTDGICTCKLMSIFCFLLEFYVFVLFVCESICVHCLTHFLVTITLHSERKRFIKNSYIYISVSFMITQSFILHTPSIHAVLLITAGSIIIANVRSNIILLCNFNNLFIYFSMYMYKKVLVKFIEMITKINLEWSIVYRSLSVSVL